MAKENETLAKLQPAVLENIAQSTLAAKANGNNAKSLAESLGPLVEGDAELEQLVGKLLHHADQAAKAAYELYRIVARPAFMAKDN